MIDRSRSDLVLLEDLDLDCIASITLRAFAELAASEPGHFPPERRYTSVPRAEYRN